MIQIFIFSQSQNLRDNHAWTVSPSQSLKNLIVSFFNLIHIYLEYLWGQSSLIWESLVLGRLIEFYVPLLYSALTNCVIYNVIPVLIRKGLPRWLSDIEFACQCRRYRRHEFAPWTRQIPWRRKWQLAPVFLPGKSHGQRILAGYSPWDHKRVGLCIFTCVYLKNWYFEIVVLEKVLESPLDCNEVKPVNPKGNQPSIFAGRAEAEAPIFWPPDAKSQLIGKKTRLIGKDPDAAKDLGKKRKVQQRMRWLNSITNTIWCKWIWAKSGREWRTGKPGVLQSAGLQSQTWLSNWATITNILTWNKDWKK